MTVPNVSYRVEIAWTSNWRTAAVDRVWTDVSAYVELQDGIGIDYGRSDEVSTADANTLSLTLDNTDGRFTWGNASSPYSPNVKVGRPIRVTAIVGASEYVRFTGYVNDWPVEWPGDSTTYAKATITASSRLSRLGLQAPVGHVLDNTIESTSPTYYWPLVEPAGVTKATEAQSRANAIEAEAPSGVTFGAGTEESDTDGLNLDGRPAVRLGSSFYAPSVQEAGGRMSVSVPGMDLAAGCSISLFVRVLEPSTSSVYDALELVRFGRSGTDARLSIRLGYMALFGVTASDYAEALLPVGLAEESVTRHVTMTVTYSAPIATVRAYVDGVLVATASDAFSVLTSFDPDTLTISRPYLLTDTRNATVGRVALWNRPLTADEVAMISEAGHTAFSGDTTDERLQRYATWGRIPAAEVTTTASPVTLTAAQATEVQVESLMRQVETAEAGVLYDDRSGNLVLKPRSARYSAPVALTVPFSEDRVSGYQPKVDRQGLANVGTGKSSSGAEVTYTNEASREEYGDHEYSVETTALDPGEPLQLAAWQVNRNAEPRPRVPAPSLSVIDWLDSADLTALLGLDIGSLLRLTGAPSQAPNATSADYFVEGYSEEIGVGTWTLSPNLTPVTLEDDALILDSATDGVLDSNVLAL